MYSMLLKNFTIQSKAGKHLVNFSYTEDYLSP